MRFLICLFLIFSCSTQRPKRNLVREELTAHYAKSTVSEYFLPNMPDWTNFSQTGNCKRHHTINYLNFSKLSQSFNLRYQDLLQLQYLFNKDFMKRKLNKDSHIVGVNEEDKIFFQSKERILGGYTPFPIPDFKQIHLIWIDPALNSEKELNHLKKLLSSGLMKEGHPVFVSMCLGYWEIVQFIDRNQFADIDIRIIPAETFSIYDKKIEERNIFQVNFDSFFPKEKRVIIFVPNGYSVPKEFKGEFLKKQF